MRKQFQVLFCYNVNGMHTEDLCVVKAFNEEDALNTTERLLAKHNDFKDVKVKAHTAIEL